MDKPFAELDDLYREVVLDHYRSPRGREALPAPDVQQEGFNPVCGDEVHVALEMEDGRIRNIQIRSRGCACAGHGHEHGTTVILLDFLVLEDHLPLGGHEQHDHGFLILNGLEYLFRVEVNALP